MPSPQGPHVVIIGGGFGGMAAARGLRRAPVRITIVDRSNHHLFQPLLYQVATAALSPADIASPIRRIFRGQENVSVMLAEATAVDVAAKRVVLADGHLDYDILIIATGATHAYFGHDEWAEHSTGLKSLRDALHIRQQVLMAFEIAEREPDDARRRAWMTFVIVGGGPTGVELAGTLAEVSRQTLARDFRHINTASARVILVEAGPRVLSAYTDDLSEAARKQLEKLGVSVWTGVQVTGIDADGVCIGAERVHARTVLWAAGVAGSPLARTLGVPLDRAGRVLVEPELTIPGRDDVYVIGDLAHIEQDGALVPGVAPAAMQQGQLAARNILATAERPAAAAVSLRRQGDARHHRPRRGGRQDRPVQDLGIPRLAALAVRPHPLPDRLPQPAGRDDPVGVVVLHVRPRRAADHRAAQGAAAGGRAAGGRRAVRNLRPTRPLTDRDASGPRGTLRWPRRGAAAATRARTAACRRARKTRAATRRNRTFGRQTRRRVWAPTDRAGPRSLLASPGRSSG